MSKIISVLFESLLQFVDSTDPSAIAQGPVVELIELSNAEVTELVEVTKHRLRTKMNSRYYNYS